MLKKLLQKTKKVEALVLPKRIRNHVNPLSDTSEDICNGFSNKKPIIVDIGAYRGEFSERMLRKFSHKRNFIVCEIRKPYKDYLEELFKGKKNVVVLGGDASRNIKNILMSSINRGVLIEYIFINFPDPWFKEKHKKRRQLGPVFLENIKEFLPQETQIVFQTDQKQLFQETKEYITNAGLEYEEFDQPICGVRSYWEEMKIKEGNSVHRLVLRNN